MKSFTVEDIHKLLLEMASMIHDLCTRHEIPYYMLGGTMLGAVRHKGFIPWDDDMDFGIPREHYQRFIIACRLDMPDYYKLLTYENSDYAILGYAKLSDGRTTIEEEFSPRTNETLGINIDIFPLDDAKGGKNLFSYNFYIRSLFKLQKLLFMKAGNRPWPKRLLAQGVQLAIPIGKNLIPHYLERLLIARSKDSKYDYEYWANYFGAWGLKEVVNKKIFGVPTPHTFENLILNGVECPDQYLSQLYGNYMQLPPVENRHLHQSNVYTAD